jgi:hypothetical protein
MAQYGRQPNDHQYQIRRETPFGEEIAGQANR